MDIENRVQIRPLLYSSQPIRLQIFFVQAMINYYPQKGLKNYFFRETRFVLIIMKHNAGDV